MNPQFGFNSMIDMRPTAPEDASTLQDLFTRVFTESEGTEEGIQVGRLVKVLMGETDPQDWHGTVAETEGRIVGAIFFSRLRFGDPEAPEAMLLSPVAVDGTVQGRGVGEALITHGLEAMQARGVNLVMTYGDPAFYRKVGFEPASLTVIPPPFDLSQPQGWLGQCLTGDPILEIRGPSTCVSAFDDPSIW